MSDTPITEEEWEAIRREALVQFRKDLRIASGFATMEEFLDSPNPVVKKHKRDLMDAWLFGVTG